jgi:hypothetical protein
MELLHYLTRDGRDLYQEWLDALRDTRARVAIDRRVERLAGGNPAIASSAGRGCGNCGSIAAPATGCITRRPVRHWFCCSVVATKAARTATLTKRLAVGATGRGGTDHDQIPFP